MLEHQSIRFGGLPKMSESLAKQQQETEPMVMEEELATPLLPERQEVALEPEEEGKGLLRTVRPMPAAQEKSEQYF